MFHALLLHSSGDSEWCPGKGAIPLRAGSIDNWNDQWGQAVSRKTLAPTLRVPACSLNKQQQAAAYKQAEANSIILARFRLADKTLALVVAELLAQLHQSQLDQHFAEDLQASLDVNRPEYSCWTNDAVVAVP